MRDDELQGSVRRIVLRAVLLLAPLAALALAAPRAISWWKHRSGPAPAVGFDRPPTDEELATFGAAEWRLGRLQSASGSDAIVPTDAVRDATGEKVRRFEGFGVSVQSEPSGAQVLVNGEDKGETPLVSSVECTVGEAVSIEVRKRGRAPQRRSTVCRKDQLIELEVQLR